MIQTPMNSGLSSLSQVSAQDSNPYGLSNDDILKFLTDLKNRLEKPISLENCIRKVLLVGKTGHGKSTVANHICNVPLVAKKDEVNRVIIDIADSIKARTKIGHSCRSETTIPAHLFMEKFTLVDLSGLQDTEKAAADITFAHYLKTIVEAPYSEIKVILVVAVNMFDNRGTGLSAILKQLVDLFPNNDFLDRNLLFLVTKTMRKTIENIQYELEDFVQCLTGSEPYKRVREIADALSKDPKRIVLFEKPRLKPDQREVEISEATRVQLLEKLEQVNYTKGLGASIAMPDQSEEFLNRVVCTLQANINYKLKEAITVLEKKCERMISSSISFEDLRKDFKNLAENLEDQRDNDMTGSTGSVSSLKRLAQFMDVVIEFVGQNEDTATWKTAILDLQYILEKALQVSYFQPVWHQEIRSLKDRIKKLTTIETVFKGNVLIIRGLLISAGKMKEYVEEKFYQGIHIYCLNTFFLDDDLKYPGIELVVRSPRLVVSGQRVIDLSGRDTTGIPSRKDGRDGPPGLPGGSSGNFVATLSKAVNLEGLTLKLNGGRGGPGAKGKDGKSGKNGVDGDINKVKKRDKAIRRSREAAKNFGAFAVCLLTLNGRFLERYTSKSTSATNGKDGGMGGKGGFGGKPGQYIITMENGVNVPGKVEAEVGREGEDGEKGRSGKGGVGGVTYTGLYMNEIVLPGLRGKGTIARPLTIFSGLVVRTSRVMPVVGIAALAVMGLQSVFTYPSAKLGKRWIEKVHGQKEDNGKDGKETDEKNIQGREEAKPNRVALTDRIVREEYERYLHDKKKDGCWCIL